MKYNLLFGGIAEKEDDVCEETVKEFINTEMKVENAKNITFVNDHGIEKKNDPKRRGRPSSIVAKKGRKEEKVQSCVEKSIWIVGSSIIKRAFQRASLSTEKSHLGLRRLNYHILWQGKGGLTWKKLFPRIQLLRRYESLPEILIIHCGGNDIGNVLLLELRLRMKETFQRIWSEFPNTLLGWSHILPRFSWHYSKNVKSQNIAVKRINSFMSKLFVVNNGFYISYPEISWDSSGLFVNDGVHLSELGNDLLLYNFQSKLQQVCSFNGERRTRSM
ncbi:uncharacterized protein LOC125651120 [Ostrea edulis]|uniref:uncharacterized protein LOC125651120 n=1 Tax=Ostrea edulis TaxID=37623 RepID=UPI0024AEAA85|nr:uncharacterized protein LOC125651120 [Ostrea edulis]